ncbi:MAG: phenylalanine--tRNA ligase subunit beta [Candidatus Binatia bacterium]
MRVPYSWLAEYTEGLPPVDELCERFTMAGLEVEAVSTPLSGSSGKLVVAIIKAIEPHPEADRLVVCNLDDGAAGRSVVCGATNMAVGDRVVVALPGARLGEGLKIKKSRIRGVVSEGMLCSAAELGVSEDHAGILILTGGAAGDDASEFLGLEDPVLELAVTPNRGDCLSVNGLVREIAAVCGLGRIGRLGETAGTLRGGADIEVRVRDQGACRLYTGLELRGLRIGPSPPWMQRRLNACGVRPLNNVIDVTNYVMLELGQPLHAFDRSKLEGSVVEVARIGGQEIFETLDGQQRTLESGDIVIRDARGAIALAGVMGGSRSAVDERTTDLFLESACFDPSSVRRTSRRLALNSESSFRFERGIDISQVANALLRAASLLGDIAGGAVHGGVARDGPGLPKPAPITLRPSRVEAILGTAVAPGRCADILSALGARVNRRGKNLSVECPPHRHDLEREIDLIEEIARVKGYGGIETVLPELVMATSTASVHRGFLERLRSTLTTRGLSETLALSFVSEEENRCFRGPHGPEARPVVLKNPLRADATELRMSMLPSLLSAWRINNRNGFEVVDLFSFGRSFGRENGETSERDLLGALLSGPRRARGPGSVEGAQFWDAKAIVEAAAFEAGDGSHIQWRDCVDDVAYHPGASASFHVGGVVLGSVGLLHPDLAKKFQISQQIYVVEVDTQKLVEYCSARPTLKPMARFPAATRDVSLLVPEDMLAGDIIAVVAQLEEPLVEDMKVFDEYRGKGVQAGKKALAFSLVYRSGDRTLTDEEITALHDRVVTRLIQQPEVELRA